LERELRVTTCPNCFEPHACPFGRFFVCQNCAVILRRLDNGDVATASPEQIDQLDAGWKTVVLEESCRVLAKKICRLKPVKVRN
jgi:hypothetical protein